MRLLLDQGLARSATAGLIDAGYDAEHVAELGMAAATDAEILSAASERDAVVVSLDSDFHSLLASSGESQPSVVRIRIEGLNAAALVELLVRVLPAIKTDLQSGAVASVTERDVRVHRLPIGSRRPK